MSSEIRPTISIETVRHLIDSQFPEYQRLVIHPVVLDGWDNRTFRLGDHLSVRLPSATGYAPQVEKEQRWLPVLAPHLPLPIPQPVAVGRPDEVYPFPWSINRWLPGLPLAVEPVANAVQLARDLAGFLGALYRAPNAGPAAGAHSFYRGGPLQVYDEETRVAIAALGGTIDGAKANQIWDAALATAWDGVPVWVHGDVAPGNLLIQDDRLCAVIDFGSSAIGDPACDTVMAWTYFSGESRAVFQRDLAVSPDVWIRGRGWALWKSLMRVNGAGSVDPDAATKARDVLRSILEDE